MTKERLSVTVSAEMSQEVRAAADRAGVSVSSWVSEAIEERIRQVSMRAFLDEWQAEQGAFTEEELAAADQIIAQAKAEMLAGDSDRLAG